ncbi:MAG: PAS domain S-box protein [Acidobacteriota bacterium]|nr:PAS domain S-box protein [Acidobacteriota bacterium]
MQSIAATQVDRFAEIVESIPEAFFAVDADWRFTYLNGRAEQIVSRRRSELVGKSLWEEFAPALGTTFEREYRRAVAEQTPVRFESFYPPLDAWLDVRAYPIKDGLAAYLQDITDQKNTEQLLRESERRYRTLIETLPQLVWTCLPNGDCDYLSSQWVDYTGIREESQLRLRWLDMVLHPADRERTYQAWMNAVKDQARYDLEYRLRRYDGVYRWFKTRGIPMRDEAGKILHWFGTCTDIDDQVRAAEELRRAAGELEWQWRMFDTALSNTPDFTYIFDLQGRFTYANRGLLALWQLTFDEAVGKNFFELDYPPELAATLHAQIQKVIETRRPLRAETPYASPAGITRQYEYIFVPVFSGNGEVERVAGSTRDITERKMAEQRLQESEESLRFALESGRMGSWEYDPETRQVNRSREYFRIFGFENPPADWNFQKFLGRVAFEDRERVQRVFNRAIGSRDDLEFETRYTREDGETRWIWVRGRHHAGTGERTRIVGIISDISERKRVEERLREAAKLESIGVLAGGVAHDFNNLLTGILGNASLAIDELGERHPARRLIGEVLRSGERASELTRQMLAYSGRGKFVLSRFDLSAMIREIAALITASIPRLVDLQLDLADGRTAIEADRAQIEQLAMNLIVNAAEAIGDRHGTVRVNTFRCPLTAGDIRGMNTPFDIPPGNYICLEVQDNGCGMDEDTQTKIFDPFFTTKFVGRGLGLSAVLGILRGHEGALKLESQPGAGTKFHVFLPAFESGGAPIGGGTGSKMRGAATVLVVDDEETVRRTAQTMLERSGFRVICAVDGDEAIDIFRARAGEIDAVLLDIRMPLLDAEKTLPRLLDIRGDARVILSCGYSEAEALTRFAGPGIARFLQKPYTAFRLVDALRQIGVEPVR